MKTAILAAALLYAICSLAVTDTYCENIGTATTCLTLGLGSTGTSSGVITAPSTSTGLHITVPTIIPNVNGSYFTYPDGTVIYDANDSVDVLWVTNSTNYSIYLNCTLNATGVSTSASIVQSQAINNGVLKGYLVDGVTFKLPNVSAICIMGMLDAHGNYLAESAYFNVRDAVGSSTTWGALPTAITTSASSARSTPSTSTPSITSTASSLTSSSSTASSSIAPSTTATSASSSKAAAATTTKASSSGSKPSAGVQAIIGILAGAVGLAMLH